MTECAYVMVVFGDMVILRRSKEINNNVTIQLHVDASKHLKFLTYTLKGNN